MNYFTTNYQLRTPNRRGFTLIEMIVVIAVITLLSGIALVSFNRYQKSARDLQRKQIITGIQSALEKYYADNGSYPSGTNFCGALNTLISSGYINAPTDPGCSGGVGSGPYTYVLYTETYCRYLTASDITWSPRDCPNGKPGGVYFNYRYSAVGTPPMTYTVTLDPESGSANQTFSSPR